MPQKTRLTSALTITTLTPFLKQLCQHKEGNKTNKKQEHRHSVLAREDADIATLKF